MLVDEVANQLAVEGNSGEIGIHESEQELMGSAF